MKARTSTLRRLAWTAAALTAGLIVLGGVVRITGSGMGCGDHWPLCNGEWFPPLDLPTFIEIFHRWIAALVSIAVVALAWVAWRRHRIDGELLRPALLAVVLLVAQVLLGAVTVKLELPPAVVIVHFLNAMVLLAVVTLVALRAGHPPPPLAPRDRHADHKLVVAVFTLGFVTIFLGGETANLNASFSCLGFPLCNGSVAPPAGGQGLLHWTHRLLAFGLAAALLWLPWRLRGKRAGRPLRRAAWGAVAAALGQIGIGAAMILALLPTTLRAAHLFGGTAVWLALVVLVFHSAREPKPG